MVETSARLLRLLSLLQSTREWSGADLAERLGVTPRTVRRDVERLRSLGYPVHSSTGTAGGYQLGAGAQLPPLLLDDEEAVAVAVGLRGASSGVQGIEEASARALAKLEQVMPYRLRRRLNALNAYTVPMTRAYRGPSVEASLITELAHACRDQQQLRLSYEAHDGSVSRRSVEPHRLVSTYRRWYLVGWDTEREDWRTFRVDRITLTPPHGPRFAPRQPPAGDLAAWVSEGVAVRAYPAQAEVLLHVPIERAAEAVSLHTGTLEAVDEHSCLLRTGGPSLEVILPYILMLGFDFEVRAPEGLLSEVRVLRDRLDRALGGS